MALSWQSGKFKKMTIFRAEHVSKKCIHCFAGLKKSFAFSVDSYFPKIIWKKIENANNSKICKNVAKGYQVY